MLESRFQNLLIKEIKKSFPGSIILKNDPSYIQGFPDLLVLNGERWGALETKSSLESSIQPNQKYYVDLLNSMSYADFVYPENKERILNELQEALRIRRIARLLRSK